MMLLSAAPSGALLTAVVLVAVAAYVLGAYPLHRIAKHTADHADTAWYAWVPVLSLVLMCRIARVSAWTMLVLLLSFIPLLGVLVALGYQVYLWAKVGQRFGRTGLGVVAAIVPLVGAWVFAFSIRPEQA